MSDQKYHSALVESLQKNELGHIVSFVERNIGAAICLITETLNGSEVVSFFSCMRKDISQPDFFNCLEQAANCQMKSKITNNYVHEEIAVNAKSIQQNFADLLGDRDYDRYEFNEHDHLKKSIAYAVCGPPMEEKGYSEKVEKEVTELYEKILNKNSK